VPRKLAHGGTHLHSNVKINTNFYQRNKMFTLHHQVRFPANANYGNNCGREMWALSKCTWFFFKVYFRRNIDRRGKLMF